MIFSNIIWYFYRLFLLLFGAISNIKAITHDYVVQLTISQSGTAQWFHSTLGLMEFCGTDPWYGGILSLQSYVLATITISTCHFQLFKGLLILWSSWNRSFYFLKLKVTFAVWKQSPWKWCNSSVRSQWFGIGDLFTLSASWIACAKTLHEILWSPHQQGKAHGPMIFNINSSCGITGIKLDPDK